MTGGEGAGLGVPGPREVNKMKAVTKVIFLDEAGEKFFGEGPCRLLHGVEETGSLRAAAQSMGMAYTKALKLVRRAEGVLGFALTTRTAGGRDGGGSSLTPPSLPPAVRVVRANPSAASAWRTSFRALV